MNAAGIAAALAERAEAVCRQYLPHGRRQGRYWDAGDLDGARGRSLFVRLRGPGTPGKWTDMATSEHGDLLDLIRHRSRAPTLRAALDEARAFLALKPAPDSVPEAAPSAGDSYDATEAAHRLWARCRAIDGSHAERSRRRCAPRSSRCSPRSPWPAAPAAGIAPARFGDTPCLAGAGFAVHRLAHRAVQSRPHKCGQRRRRYRRRAAHDPVQLPLHFPPLKRRGGSDEPPSPATISRTLMLHDWPSRTAGAASVFTPDASLMLALPWLPMPAIGWSPC